VGFVFFFDRKMINRKQDRYYRVDLEVYERAMRWSQATFEAFTGVVSSSAAVRPATTAAQPTSELGDSQTDGRSRAGSGSRGADPPPSVWRCELTSPSLAALAPPGSVPAHMEGGNRQPVEGAAPA